MVSIGSNLVGNLSNVANTFANKPTASGTVSEVDFKDILSDAMDKLGKVSDENAQATLDLLSGNTDDLSNTMISAQKSEIAINLTVAIRNKAVEAYKEIMNMQV